MGMRISGISAALWLAMAIPAFAATAGAAKSAGSPPIWDQAINALASLINWVAAHVGNDYGLGLIIVVIFIRMLTVPLMLRSLRNTKRMQLLQPRMKELKQEHGKDPRKYQEQVMLLYKSEGVNPLAGCMPMIVQMVVLTILYRAIYTDHLMLNSTFLGIPLGVADTHFTGVLLGSIPYLLPVLAGVTSFFQQKVSMASVDQSQKMLLYIFPVMIFFMATRFAAALALYWVISNVFTMVQMYFTHVKPASKQT